MTLDEINQKYNDETYPVFPFISKNIIVMLKSGLYRKHKANFRGVTAVYNEETKEYEFPLYGMYFIEEDMVIVPPDLELSPNKQVFLQAALNAGYVQSDRAPKFKTIKFPPDSEEAKLALANKLNYQSNSVTQ
jgi:hypothetical protein